MFCLGEGTKKKCCFGWEQMFHFVFSNSVNNKIYFIARITCELGIYTGKQKTIDLCCLLHWRNPRGNSVWQAKKKENREEKILISKSLTGLKWQGTNDYKPQELRTSISRCAGVSVISPHFKYNYRDETDFLVLWPFKGTLMFYITEYLHSTLLCEIPLISMGVCVVW